MKRLPAILLLLFYSIAHAANPAVLNGFDRPNLDYITGTYKVGLIIGTYSGSNMGADFIITGGGIEKRSHVDTFTANDQSPDARINGEPKELKAVLTINASDWPKNTLLTVVGAVSDGISTGSSMIQLWVNCDRTVYTMGIGTEWQDSLYAATVYADQGAIVYLKAGTYKFDWTRNTGFRDSGGKLLTFCAASGVDPSQVIILFDLNNYDPRASDLEFKNVTLQFADGVTYQNSASWGHSPELLLTHCLIRGDISHATNGANRSSIISNQYGPFYVFGCDARNFPATPFNLPSGIYGTSIINTFGHPVNLSGGNVTQTYISKCQSGTEDGHIDALFAYNGGGIMAGVTMNRVEGLNVFGQGNNNLLLRNVKADASGIGVGGASQIGKPIGQQNSDSIYLENVVMPNQRMIMVYQSPQTDPNNYQTFSNCIIRGGLCYGAWVPVPGVFIVPKTKPTVPLPGDYTGDGQVDWADMEWVSNNFGHPYTFADTLKVAQNYGRNN